ncbi:hypothetical protein NKH77_15030 [Streptomyces sp. M19]
MSTDDGANWREIGTVTAPGAEGRQDVGVFMSATNGEWRTRHGGVQRLAGGLTAPPKGGRRPGRRTLRRSEGRAARAPVHRME